MRKYQPIWEQIKANGYAQVKAEPNLHARIVKAVIKEKNKDLGFKQLALEIKKVYKLNITYTGSIILFSLEDATPTYIRL